MHEYEELISHGYELIRLNGKIPIDKGWRTIAPLRDPKPEWNVGVRLKVDDLVVDVDPRNGGDVGKLGDINLYARVATGGGGLHIYMKKPAELATRHTVAGLPGVEFKTLGRQVVAPGGIHPNGKRYEWEIDSPGLPARMAPDWLLRMIATRAEVAGEGVVGNLAEMLAALDVMAYRDHDAWFAIMCSAHEVSGGSGVEEFVAWSIGDPQYCEAEGAIRSRWATLETGKPGNAGAGTLRAALVRAGHGDLVQRDVGDDFSGDEVVAEVPDNLWQKMCRWYKCVDEDGRLRVFAQRQDEVLDRKYWVKYARRDFLEVCCSVKHLPQVSYADREGKDKWVAAGVYWLDMYKKKETYEGVTFAPECSEARTADGKLNLWQGFAVGPRMGTWDYLKELTWETLCDRDDSSYEYVMRWMARAVQRPWEPGQVALVFKGAKGTGKSTLGTMFAGLFGRHGMHITSPSLLTGRFNMHLRDVCALFADEAFWAGDRASEGVLKGLVTERAITYEGKGTNAEMGRNCVHIVMASNNDWVVPAGLDGERRFAIFQVDPGTHDKAYWTALRAEMAGGGRAAMLYDLLAMNISEFDVFGVPQTGALAMQKMEGMEVYEQWIYELVASGNWGGLVKDVANAEVNRVLIPTIEMQASLLQFYASAGVRPGKRAADVQVGFCLGSMLKDVRRARAKADEHGHRAWLYDLPSLEYARMAISLNLGRTFENA